jgi:hypothetical protein
MIMQIYKAYIALYDAEKMAWKILEDLYGKNTFPAGGGIINELQIYEQARWMECDYLRGLMNVKLEEMNKLQMNWQKVMEAEIKPTTFY